MKHVRFIYRSFVILFLLGVLNLAHAFATNCEGLASMTISHVEITSATEVAAGKFTPLTKSEPSESAGISGFVPAFCRVVGVARPTSDSVINFEVWLPTPSTWNEKFEGVGNGGYVGSISYGAMENAITRGYATASTDT
jgi:feruloyl esterase